MRKLFYLACILCMVSCSSGKPKTVEFPSTYISGERLIKDTENSTPVSIIAEVNISEKNRIHARRLAYGKEFIDLNIDSVSYLLHKERIMPDEVSAMKIKAITYRFYSQVQQEDRKLLCSVEKGADIHISERVFNTYKKNLEETNKRIQESVRKGVDIYLGEINERVLSTLFDD